MAPVVTRPKRAFQTARPLQAAVPFSATFAVPVLIRLDPDGDDSVVYLGSSVFPQFPPRTTSVYENTSRVMTERIDS